MAVQTPPLTGGSDLLEAYKSQISALQNDPNATPAYKQQLDDWLRQLETALGRAEQGGQGEPTSSSGAGQQSGGAHNGSSGPLQDIASEHGTRRSTDVPDSGESSGNSASGSTLQGDNIPPALAEWMPLIESAAQKTGVPVEMLAAMLWNESKGDPNALAPNPDPAMGSDTGLMQVSEGLFKDLQSEYPELQGKSLTDPETNIMAAAYRMADMLEKFGGNKDLALRAYNSGENSVDPTNPNVMIGGLGTGSYVQNVNSILSALENGGSLPA